jgi:hypothetical protein
MKPREVALSPKTWIISWTKLAMASGKINVRPKLPSARDNNDRRDHIAPMIANI